MGRLNDYTLNQIDCPLLKSNLPIEIRETSCSNGRLSSFYSIIIYLTNHINLTDKLFAILFADERFSRSQRAASIYN